MIDCSAQVYFVVMRNFLPVRTWLAFDLKGATANRRALAARFLHRIGARAEQDGCAYGTLRDWEWLDIAMCRPSPPVTRHPPSSTPSTSHPHPHTPPPAPAGRQT